MLQRTSTVRSAKVSAASGLGLAPMHADGALGQRVEWDRPLGLASAHVDGALEQAPGGWSGGGPDEDLGAVGAGGQPERAGLGETGSGTLSEVIAAFEIG